MEWCNKTDYRGSAFDICMKYTVIIVVDGVFQ